MAPKTHNADFISNLPEPLLEAILSRVPFKEAARTSVLSRRWRHKWRSTASIDLNQRFFVKIHDGDDEDIDTDDEVNDDDYEEVKNRQFIDFARDFVNNHKSSLNSLLEFRLAFSDPGGNEFANDIVSLMAFGTSRNPKVLSLDFTDPVWPDHDEKAVPTFNLPDVVYTHKNPNLESLTLHHCGFLVPRLVESWFLARVKELSLGLINMGSDSLRFLVASCPVLEALCLKKVWNTDGIDITVPAGSRLERVMIDMCSMFSSSVAIAAPRLKILEYHGPLCSFKLDDSDCLEEAVLNFTVDYAVMEEHYVDWGTREYVKFMSKTLMHRLSGVRVLRLTDYLLKELREDESLSMNVRRLTLNMPMHENEVRGMTHLLKSCPLLEYLKVELVSLSYAFKEKDEGLEFYNCSCIKNTLRVVEVEGYSGGDNMNRLLSSAIEHGKAMEKMSIDVWRKGGFDRKTALRKARQEFKRPKVKASQGLEITIS